MDIGISVEPLGPHATRAAVLGTARTAEERGFSHVLMSSHLLAGALDSATEGAVASAADPVVLLAAVAGATERVRLATSVLVLPYYHPVVLANQLATLDVLSGGRLTLTVGVGWNPAEFAAVGVPRSARGRTTDDHLAVLQELWAGGPVDRRGDFGALEGAELGVTPLTPGGPPVWVGGHSDAALGRAARFGAGWHGTGVVPDDVAELRERIEVQCGRVGRDPGELQLSTVCFLAPPGMAAGPLPGAPLGGAGATAQRIVDDLGLLHERGFDMFSFWMPVSPERFGDALEWVAAEVLPAVGERPAAARTTT